MTLSSGVEVPQKALAESPKMVAVRGFTHAIGLRIVAARSFEGLGGSVGIWKWIDETVKAISEAKRQGRWEYDVPDIETVRRRISELADPRIQDPPLWRHLDQKYSDVHPRTSTVRLQSTYTPMMEAMVQ